eukprot:6421040-Alexandrium_andersonii.AAC.1
MCSALTRLQIASFHIAPCQHASCLPTARAQVVVAKYIGMLVLAQFWRPDAADRTGAPRMSALCPVACSFTPIWKHLPTVHAPGVSNLPASGVLET